jgi:hypothetical protein
MAPARNSRDPITNIVASEHGKPPAALCVRVLTLRASLQLLDV